MQSFIEKFDEPYTKQLRISIKNNIWIKGYRCAAGSHLLQNFIPTENAFVVDSLKSEGYNIVGTVHCEEFASGSLGKNTHVKLVIPNTNRVAGGSSVGSGLSVLSGESDVSVGTDSGGSLRLPSLCTGLYGFKPSYGVVSRYGVIDLCNSLDCVGLIGRNLSEMREIFKVINKYDRRDQSQIKDVVLSEGFNRVIFVDEAKPEEYTENTLNISLSDFSSTIMSEYYRRSDAYFWSNLMRFDGRRFNKTFEGYKDSDKAQEDRLKGLMPAAKERFLRGHQIVYNGIKESIQWKQFLDYIKPYSNDLLIFKSKNLNIDYQEEVSVDMMNAIDWPLAIANLLGRPSISTKKQYVLMGPMYSDLTLLNLEKSQLAHLL